MPRRVNITEARARLPELARYVARSDDKVVLIEHRDMEEPLALTTAAHLDYLNLLIAELRKCAGEPFQLAGSIASDLSDDELETALAELRAEQRRSSEAKLHELAE